MAYKDYLKSTHWREFRKEILSRRPRCQGCGAKKVVRHIHHKNYKCLGRETNDDVLVLCGDCHFKYHRKEKWKRAMREGKELSFTKATDRAILVGSKYYNASKETRVCRRCGREHSLFYKVIKTGTRLAMACPESKPRTEWLKFEKNLDIPTY